MALEFHPLANIFDPLDGPEFDALVADIRKHGLREAVVLFEGQILDGRNRYRACQIAGIDIRTEPFSGGDPRAYVYSMNLHRRHLSQSQRGIHAAEVANMERGRPEAANGQICPFVSIDQAAETFNVSRRTVINGRTVLNKGTAAEVAAVKRGEVTVGTLAEDIRKGLPPDKRGKNKQPRGPKIKTDKTIEELCREGLALQVDGATIEETAKALGINDKTYKLMRDVVLLADRTDLPEREAVVARAALEEMNATKMVTPAHAKIASIAARVWGASSARRGFRGPERVEAVRAAAFERACGMIVEVCDAATQMTVPHMTKEKAAETATELNVAARTIRKLRERVMAIHGQTGGTGE